ncbi:charged multivesicular body protein 6-A-like [Orbicella faveolata]|uniref:charged multivesicular body protein 6-A-like n=1 Tax=Orbicella faveolata TaxID=48498 RepID=UPI0009E39ED8|nr:charged multivesicular body protein 6-A-like [Orbicella faveolata]
MGSLFSKKKEPEKPKITEQDKAILALKQQRDKLKQYQKKVLNKTQAAKQTDFGTSYPLGKLALKQQRDKLKQYQKKVLNKTQAAKQTDFGTSYPLGKLKAKLLLKKKRYQEQTLERTDNQLDNLEKMVQDVEFAQVQIQVADGLKQGNEALKKMHEIMSIEDVERIMDETREGIEYQREIDDLLSGSLTQEDEDAVLQELEEMTQSVTENLPEVPTEPLPEVPTKEPGEKRPQKERVASREAEMVPA